MGTGVFVLPCCDGCQLEVRCTVHRGREEGRVREKLAGQMDKYMMVATAV